MTFRQTATLMVLGASTAIVTPAFGQQAQPGRPNPNAQVQPNSQAQPNAARTGMAQAHVNEQGLAACVAIENQEEVAIAQFASEKAKNKDVKDFAKMLVEDHQAFLKKLQRFTPEAANQTLQASSDSKVQQAGGAASQSTGSPQQANRPIQQTGAQTEQAQPLIGQRPQSAGVDVIQLHREIAQQCLADSKKKMSEEDGAKFDFCFIGQQIAKHQAMKTKLTVIHRHSSGEFAQLLADGLETTEEHLQKAEKIMEDLADKNDSSKKDDRTERRNERRESKSEKE